MKLLDPICDMIVDVAEQRDQGLTLEMDDREYAFCSHGCLTKFAKSPQQYIPRVTAWLAGGDAAAPSHGAHAEMHGHSDALPTIDQGMREWYKACRCCLSDAYPKIVEALDAERTAASQAPADAGICVTAEAAPQRP